MTVGDMVFYVNAFLFSMSFGIYWFIVRDIWKMSRWPRKMRLSVNFVVIAWVVYGFIEAASQGVKVAPRHWIGMGVGVWILVTMIVGAIYDESDWSTKEEVDG